MYYMNVNNPYDEGWKAWLVWCLGCRFGLLGYLDSYRNGYNAWIRMTA